MHLDGVRATYTHLDGFKRCYFPFAFESRIEENTQNKNRKKTGNL